MPTSSLCEARPILSLATLLLLPPARSPPCAPAGAGRCSQSSARSLLLRRIAFAHAHQLDARRRFEPEALGGDLFVELQARDAHLQPIVIVRPLEPDVAWKIGRAHV